MSPYATLHAQLSQVNALGMYNFGPICLGSVFFFFFSSRRRHTRCSRDWSSDVCSSDLTARDQPARGVVVIFLAAALAVHSFGFGMVVSSQDVLAWVTPGALYGVAAAIQIGRASCRERV